MSKKKPEVKVFNVALEGTLLPPPVDKCPKCAAVHPPEAPHNQQSLFWQYFFYRQSGGRWPTWGDAMAHCTEDVRAQWTEALRERGIEVVAP